MPKLNRANLILRAALRLHDRGLWIVPCNGKGPIWPNWQRKRGKRSDLEQALKGSQLNIALVLNQSDYIDVECDTPEAEQALQAMFNGRLPPTPTWQSRRGKHRLFRRPKGLPKRSEIVLDGVEFRIGNGKGAASVIPPSIHPDTGKPYRWVRGLSLDNVEPAALPADIVKRLKAPSAENPEGSPITEGARNTTLFKLACKLRETGASPQAIRAALRAENRARCRPPLPDAEVDGLVRSACSQDRRQSKQTGSQVLLDIVRQEAELWHDGDEAFATIHIDNHVEHYRIGSRRFRRWLSARYYHAQGQVATAGAMQDALNTIEGLALHEGQSRTAALRVAEHNGNIYLDLGDDSWRAVEITPEDWRVVDKPPVRFRRTAQMLPLPKPVRGGNVDELRRFVNVSDKHWPLLLGFQIMCFRPTGPFPILKLLGEQGSGKTTQAEIIRSTIDPNKCLLRRPARSERDLMIAAFNNWLVGFDNVSYFPPELCDALCCLATGGGFGTRTLYTDQEETTLVAERPVLVTGIEDPGLRSDLMDRCLVLEAPRIEDSERQDEQTFWAKYRAAQPRILGALLDAVSMALRRLPEVKQAGGNWPRMADFAQWVTAAEPAIGLADGQFVACYETNRQEAASAVLEASPVIRGLVHALDRNDGVLEGTATELLEKISVGQDTHSRQWPKNGRALSAWLTRAAPNLRANGFTIKRYREQNQKLWRITYASTQSTQVAGIKKPLPAEQICERLKQRIEARNR